MSTPVEQQPKRERTWIYIVAVVLLIGLGLWAVLAFGAARQSREAEEKADRFITLVEAAGVRTPDKDQVIRILGDDGGAACANPNAALSRATLNSMLANGATGPGARPVISDRRAVLGQLLIIEVYCPAELDEFKASIDDLKTDDVTGT
ncbi:hypothetical protein GCM10009636_27310 [Arthrobacter koreensis]|jgi:hypothetical protein|uniref:DUF732 domain-containing protein n=1 Tax=Arthrobacter koreensis TaxID=199136 RepID=A0ABY6FUD6_9MICC|nr:hypothetical protein [Arthrobacter koreensis]MDF2498520.1 hypothetical protein [Arthrobacter koreensis]UYB36392.1 hypothetical protein N9A08_01500 [Arthrobacter koreensis]